MMVKSCRDFIIKIFKELIILKRKLLETNISKLRLITVVSLTIKTILFLALIQVGSADIIKPINLNFKFTFIYVAFILLFYSIGYLFSKNKQIIFQIIFNLLYSALVIADLWYFRANNYLLGLRNLFYSGTFNPLGKSLYNFKLIDVIFVIDILVILIWIIVKKIRCVEDRSLGKFSFTIRYSIIIILLSYIALDVLGISDWDAKLVKAGWNVPMTTKAGGPIGYHIVEAGKTIIKKVNGESTKDNSKIEDWINENQENLSPNEYEGIAKGKNVIFLQIESLENFVINKTVNGKEITPFLNKISNKGLYFNNFYEQNNAGNSIDCDFMVNSSVFPLGGKITGLNYSENVYLNSLPRILNNQGYNTISSHAEELGEFNWGELHKNSFGVQKIWNINDYKYEETVGYGLSDKSLLGQISEKLTNEKAPFFLQVPTLSSHGPFNISDEYRELGLPEEIDKSYLGGYFESVHYTDKQIEMFFNKLEAEGLLKNSVIVIYGDHTGVHKYYNEDIQKLSYDGDWWKEVDNKIPLIIYSEGLTPKLVEAHGGQVDLLPTICYLLGVDENKYKNSSMGRVLINTNKDATIIKNNKIVGNVKNEEEKQHLLMAYDIGEKIIKSNYFSRK
ncbi:LTA synthase family protein [Clostridium sp. SHJSY1]|uniref:LTA synthase family protein n=1 Tax=Clostridium sp. SHJSY1 TaxID=2942483 RepID=UPI0028759A39|nr:LTA synthase family protein [Clostridium sp. SHJSY1]MDS0528174.1 LTA synthase family protein [Clostridium sp. SHJSY1]